MFFKLFFFFLEEMKWGPLGEIRPSIDSGHPVLSPPFRVFREIFNLFYFVQSIKACRFYIGPLMSHISKRLI